MTLSSSRAVVILVASAVAAASCGGGGGDSSTSAPKPAIQKAATASGDAQTGTVGAVLATPLRVLVTLGGNPMAGDTVTWSASGTGASVNPAQSVTDATGIAATVWTLGHVAGAQTASASASGATGSPVAFGATANAAAAVQLLKVSGDSQSAGLNAGLALPVVVRAADTFGNAAAAAVSWTVSSGSATVSPAVDTANGNGAQAAVKVGSTAGPIVVTATSSGLTGSPVTFHETGVAAASSAAVSVGDDFFKSGHNGSQNPAVDTIAVGGTVTWTWGGANNHGVQSTGSPSFTNSSIQASGTYSFTFTTAGTYTYDCAVHGAIMTGTVVVR